MKLLLQQSAIVIVYAAKRWNDSGIEISPGEKYLFEATGEWKDLLKLTGPAGYTHWYMNSWNKWKRSKDNNWFALMASLNKQAYFLIGKKKKLNSVKPAYYLVSPMMSLDFTGIILDTSP